jgi:hypothetical protein
MSTRTQRRSTSPHAPNDRHPVDGITRRRWPCDPRGSRSRLNSRHQCRPMHRRLRWPRRRRDDRSLFQATSWSRSRPWERGSAAEAQRSLLSLGSHSRRGPSRRAVVHRSRSRRKCQATLGPAEDPLGALSTIAWPSVRACLGGQQPSHSTAWLEARPGLGVAVHGWRCGVDSVLLRSAAPTAQPVASQTLSPLAAIRSLVGL